jgi:alcohol dehydrogenase (NADP+)
MKVPFLPFLTLASATNLQHPLHRIPTAALSQPPIGFGTWNIKDSPANTSDAVALAIRAGYRQIDCAAAYGNEKDVGRGIAAGLKDVGLERGDIWITSKLWNDQYVKSTKPSDVLEVEVQVLTQIK